MGGLATLEHVIVVKHTGAECEMKQGRDVWFEEIMAAADPECPAEELDAEHPLFILYTSGSTAKPKGILHTTGGYLTGVSTTHRYVFDLKPEQDVYWCSADVGWVTGHSYIVYGPMANGATSIMYEGAPDYLHKGIWWELCEQFGATIFYTAPTAIRACMKWGADYVRKHHLDKLRLLGTVGEPINPKAWLWYHEVVGGGRCPVVDTWWQTETGAIMITPPPGITECKPGSATFPFPGIAADVVDEREGQPQAEGQGLLVLTRPWPSMLRTLYKEEDRFIETYFSRFGKEMYLVGDAARKDKDGLLLGDRADRRCGQRLGSPSLDGRGRIRDRLAPQGGRGRRDRSGRRGLGPGHLRVRDPAGRSRGHRCADRGDPRACGVADRQVHPAQADHLGRRPAEDPVGQDHAPAVARHRRGAGAGRRDDAPRPRRDGPSSRGRSRRSRRRPGGSPRPPPAAAQETFSAVSSITKFVVPPALSVSEPRKRILTVWPANADRLNVSCW